MSSRSPYELTVKEGLYLYCNREGDAIEAPTTFGLTECYTAYIKASKPSQYETTRALRLLYPGFKSVEMIKRLGFDGYTTNDHNGLIEITLFNPSEVLSFVRELKHVNMRIETYPGEVDEVLLDLYTIECKHL